MSIDLHARTEVVRYGSLLTVVLSKKSRPGDGLFGRGRKG